MTSFEYCSLNNWVLDDLKCKHARSIANAERLQLDLIALNDVFPADRRKVIECFFTSNKYEFIWRRAHYLLDEEDDEPRYTINGFAMLQGGAWKIRGVEDYWLTRAGDEFRLSRNESDKTGSSVIHVRLESLHGERKNVFVVHCWDPDEEGIIKRIKKFSSNFSQDLMQDMVICGDIEHSV